MSNELQLGNKLYNPDVLSCLANLSNDEVFTPPQLANKVLDLLPEEIWHDSSITFLDPFTKTGVFLREITKRLLKGLEEEIPDLQQRIDHILNHQVWGIAITELTALLSRRTLYCSKKANGKYSIDDTFDTPDGHIHYEAIEHMWAGDKCVYCGAKRDQYDRSSGLESYTYEFIHTYHPERIFNMQFDVIVGNPPYQLSDGGFGKSAAPIYQKFVEQAQKMNPRYISMIIPSRWFGGGKGLNDFRASMLTDKRIRQLVDFENANDCFPGVDLAGGVCYFLWDRDHPGQCEVKSVVNGDECTSVRDLDEFKIFVRNSRAVPIVRKVIAAYSAYDHAGNPDKNGMRKVFTKIHVLLPKTICTETYLVIGAFDSEEEALNLKAYMETRFFRFLVSQFMFSQHITREAYAFVPVQDFTKEWTDAKLYKKYGIDADEQAFIESVIRPMDGDK